MRGMAWQDSGRLCPATKPIGLYRIMSHLTKCINAFFCLFQPFFSAIFPSYSYPVWLTSLAHDISGGEGKTSVAISKLLIKNCISCPCRGAEQRTSPTFSGSGQFCGVFTLVVS
jgi:hypothetical protein